MFAFRLALALGYVDPDVLMETLTPGLWREWRAYQQIEPFGPLVSWHQQARMMALMMNNMTPHLKHYHVYKPDEFMPTFVSHPVARTPGDIYATLRTWAMMNGAKKTDRVGA